MANESEFEATSALAKDILHYVDCPDVDWWCPHNSSEKQNSYNYVRFNSLSDNQLLDYGAFLLYIGYKTRDFSEEWEKYKTKRVHVGDNYTLLGYSGQVDSQGNVELTPDYDSTPEYEDQKILKDSGKVSDIVYFRVNPKSEKCCELRKEFQNHWLAFYSKNRRRTFPDGYYLNVKTNTLDRAKFKFKKQEETDSEIKRNKRINLPFLLLSIVALFLTPLAFLFSLKGVELQNLGDFLGILVFRDPFIHLKPDFNYVLFYSLWAVTIAISLANCIYYGEYQSWALLVVYLIFSVVVPFGTTAVLFIVFEGKTCAFDFFAFLLTCVQFVMEIPILLCLFLYRPLRKKRFLANAEYRNKERKDLLSFLSDFQSRGLINSYSEYLKKWTDITGREYPLGN